MSAAPAQHVADRLVLVGRALAGSVAGAADPQWAVKNKEQLAQILALARPFWESKLKVIEKNEKEIRSLTSAEDVVRFTADNTVPLLYSILDADVIDKLEKGGVCEKAIQAAHEAIPRTAKTQGEPVTIGLIIGGIVTLGRGFFKWLREREKTKQEKERTKQQEEQTKQKQEKTKQAALKAAAAVKSRDRSKEAKKDVGKDVEEEEEEEEEEKDELYQEGSLQQWIQEHHAEALPALSNAKDLALA